VVPPSPARLRCAVLLAGALLLSGCGGEVSDDAELLDEGYCADEVGGLAARVVLIREIELGGELLLRVDKYDEHEGHIAHLMDYDEDGSIEYAYVTSWTYDERGNWTVMQEDTDSDGDPDIVRNREFDGAGNLILEWSETDPTTTVAYTYDEQGRLTSIVSTGQVAATYIHEYDQDGWTVISTDFYSDGTVDSVQREQVLNDGSLVINENDNDGNGVMDQRYETTVDEQGQVLEFVADHDGDGALDFVQTNTYTSSGEPLQQSTDQEGDGAADLTTDYHYGSGGRLETVTTTGEQGELVSETAYTYDGELVTQTRSDYYEGSLTAISSITLGPDGPKSSWIDIGGDGERERWETYVDCP